MGFSLADLNPFKAVADKLIDRLVPDKNANAAAKAELEKMELSGELAAMSAQAEINKVEAASPNLFVAGWRPAVGWTCCAGLAIQFIVRPLFIWGSALIGHPTDFPSLDMGTLMVLLTGMLGFGGLRSFEKVQGAEHRR